MPRATSLALSALLVAACGSTVGAGGRPAVGSAAAPPGRATGRADDGVREVVVQDGIGVPRLDWLAPGDVTFARHGERIVPLIAGDGPTLSFRVEASGEILVDERSIGWDLTELGPGELDRLVGERRGGLRTIVIADLAEVTPALQDAVLALAADEVALSVSVNGGSAPTPLGWLARLGPRLRGLAVWLDGGGGTLDLAELEAATGLRGLWLGNAVLEGLGALGRLPELVTVSVDVPYINPEPFDDGHLAELAGLRRLRRLEIVGGGLSSPGLERLAGLADLRALTITGRPTLPISLELSMAPLGELERLQSLTILDAMMVEADVERITDMVGLRELRLAVDAPVDLARIGRLERLFALALWTPDTSGVGLAPLADLSELRELDLGADMPTSRLGPDDVAHLAGLRSLRALRLANTVAGDGGLAHLSGLVELRSLDVASAGVTSAGLAHLRGLRELRRLDLSDSDLSAEGLAHLRGLTRLETLVLTTARGVDAAGLEQISGLGALRDLSLDSTDVGDGALAAVGRLSTLRRLDLGGAAITDEALASLAPLAGLRDLDLESTPVGDGGVAHLAALTELRSLSLDFTGVGDAGLAQLARLTRLRRLQLRQTRVTDRGLASLAPLVDLRVLDVTQTAVDGSGLAHLERAGQLWSVTAYETRLTLDAARAFERRHPRCSLSPSAYLVEMGL